MSKFNKKIKQQILVALLFGVIISPAKAVEPITATVATTVGVAVVSSLIDNVIMPTFNALERDLKTTPKHKRTHRRSTWSYLNYIPGEISTGYYGISYGQRMADLDKSLGDKILMEMIAMRDENNTFHSFVTSGNGFSCKDSCSVAIKMEGGQWLTFDAILFNVNGKQALYPRDQGAFAAYIKSRKHLNVVVPQWGQDVDYYFVNRNFNDDLVTARR